MLSVNPLNQPNGAGLCTLHLAAERAAVERLEALLDLGMHHSVSLNKALLTTDLLERYGDGRFTVFVMRADRVKLLASLESRMTFIITTTSPLIRCYCQAQFCGI
jgi:hypothetical protein